MWLPKRISTQSMGLNRSLRAVLLPAILCLLGLACSLGAVLNAPDIEEDPITPVPTEPQRTITPLPTETTQPEKTATPSVEGSKGQIAFTLNGNVWHQNLDTGEMIQLTFDGVSSPANITDYWKVHFSDSGRYLAYQYGYHFAGNTWVSVVDLDAMQEIARLEGELLVGWRYDEDVLVVGHATHICDYNDPATYVDDETISFILSIFDVDEAELSPLLTIPGGYRFPIRLSSRANLMVFQECPCEVPMCHWIQEVYTETGDTYPVEMGHDFAIATSGEKIIPIAYSIYEPNTDGLWVYGLDQNIGEEIYLEEGTFPTHALWSPDDAWIVYWLGDVETFNFYHKMMVIQPDGSESREVTPNQDRYLGWFSDGRLMVITADWDEIRLFDPETGETEPLAQLEPRVDFEEMVWSHLP